MQLKFPVAEIDNRFKYKNKVVYLNLNTMLSQAALLKITCSFRT